MSSDYVWVVGFDASTGKAMQFIRCHKNSAPFHESLYACEGYSVQTMTSEEFGELADRGALSSGLSVLTIAFSASEGGETVCRLVCRKEGGHALRYGF